MITHALYYARLGWAVFPLHWAEQGKCSCGRECGRAAKHPLVEHGVHDATTARTYVELWWRRWPRANIGIATGSISGLIVLDVDGAAGLASLASRPIPATMRATTGKGAHHYFEHPGRCQVKNAVALAPGLDLRADGGYVVAPPSVHVSGRTYAWEVAPGELDLAPAPGWIFDALFASRNADKAFSRAWRGSKFDPASVPAIGPGERNKRLASIAGRLRWEDRPFDEAEKLVLEINARNCRPPLPHQEALKVVRSIYGRYQR